MSTLRPIVLAALCGLISGCSYPHAGPTLPEGATSADEASPNPPPVMVTQPMIPAASPTYPTGHPSLKPSYAGGKGGAPRAGTTPAPATDVAVVNSSNTSATGDSSGSGVNQIAPDESATSAKVDSDSNFDNLDIVDPGLKAKLGILRIGSDPGANNLLSVFAGLKNKTSHPLALEVQTIYKDKDGAPLNDGGSWIPMTLKAHEDTEYRSSSISADAVDFVVRIRRGSENAGGAN